jgi:hypothetical protein
MSFCYNFPTQAAKLQATQKKIIFLEKSAVGERSSSTAGMATSAEYFSLGVLLCVTQRQLFKSSQRLKGRIQGRCAWLDTTPKSSKAARVEAHRTESLSAPDGRKGSLELPGHKYAVEAGGSDCRL